MKMQDFTTAKQTVVISDIHLADSEEEHPRNLLWKRFKRPEHFTDSHFESLINYISKQAVSSVELVLNGDIFDFDSIMKIPEKFHTRVNWLERVRGLSSEEEKSRYKMGVILDTHPGWVDTLRKFIIAGNRVVFVIGNHDMELHWPTVQEDLLNRLKLPMDRAESVRFCEWFYISNQDTLIEHGNQYDAYCLCSNPIHPLIKKGSRIKVRLPFGNLAGKYMINGMGLMNPHATDSYIKNSVWEYVGFYYKYMMRTQPFLLWTWFWSALVTLIYSLMEGFLPPMRDPLTVDARIKDIAARANATVSIVLALKAVHVHPAIFNPIKILRELWLDRAIFLVLILFGSFQIFSFLNIFAHVSVWGFVIPLVLLIPIFIFYSRSVQSEVEETQNAAAELAPLCARIVNVKRIVQGHTHFENHKVVDGIEVINTGTWSPAFHDVECTKPYGRKCFAWIRPKSSPDPHSETRISELYEWRDSGLVLINKT